MRTKIQKWGNSYAVRLPKQFVVKLGLKAGSDVQIDQEKESVVVKKVPAKRAVTFQDWEKYLLPMKGPKVNISGRIDEILYGKTHR